MDCPECLHEVEERITRDDRTLYVCTCCGWEEYKPIGEKKGPPPTKR